MESDSVVFATTTVQGRTSIVTMTLYRAPPTSIAVPPTQGGSKIPVAAIAGGVAAGAVLAIGVTIAWIWWGRSIDRAAEKQRREAATRYNTLRNSGGISRPRPQKRSRRPMHGRAVEKQVTFVGTGHEDGDNGGLQIPPPAARRKHRTSNLRHHSPAAAVVDNNRFTDENRARRMREVDIERGEENKNKRWSWTSSLDFLFSRSSRHYREDVARRATLAEEFSDTDGQSSRVVPMGVAL